MRRLFLAAAASFLAGSASAAPCHEYTFDHSRFAVCEFDSRSEVLRLYWTDGGGAALRSFDRLENELGGNASYILFGMNAGMFEANGMPLGLYTEDGVERRPLNTRNGGGNFYLKPNGVFEVDADHAMRIETTDEFARDRPSPQWATQSGPMLVIDGRLAPQIAPDGPSRKIRDGVGLRDRHIAFFAISDDPVSFGKLARFLRDGMGCSNALYLDGTVSSLWAPALDREDANAPLGPMLVVTAR